MVDEANSTAPQSGPTPSRRCRGRGRGRTAAFIILVALAAAIAGGFVTNAFSQGHGPWHGGAFWSGAVDPEQAERRLERAIKHLAVEADASADQQAKLVAIARDAVKDLLPLRDKARANRGQAIELLTAPTVDRAAIERFRAEQLSLAETASKRIAQALADAADVLTADQRKTLLDRVSSFGHGWGHWHRG